MGKENYAQCNREAWNEVMPLHRSARLKLYPNLEKDISAGTYCQLTEIEHRVFRGFNIQQKHVAHLCCNNGLDLISVMNLGAAYGVGFDISDEAIKEAERLAGLGKYHCEFVRTNVYEISPDYYHKFDVVFINVGGLMWLPDMSQLFEIIHSLLKPGGCFFVTDIHPYVSMLPIYFDEHIDEKKRIRLEYSYFSKDPYYASGLDYIGNSNYEGKTYCLFSYNTTDLLSSAVDYGFQLLEFKEYPKDISGQFPEIEKLKIMPLSFSLVIRKPQAKTALVQKVQNDVSFDHDFPAVTFDYYNEKLRHHLFFQQSRHLPTYGCWGSYAKYFIQCPGYARYSLPEWQPYIKLVELFSAKYRQRHGENEYDYFIVDQLCGALDKLNIFNKFLSHYEVLEKLTLPQEYPDYPFDTDLYLIRTARRRETRLWQQDKKLGFVGCYPSVFRIMPFIFGKLDKPSIPQIKQHSFYSLNKELKYFLSQLATRDEHLLFSLVSNVLSTVPFEIFAQDYADAHYVMGVLRNNIDNMVNQKIQTITDFDNLCLYHEMIHHALYMLCVFARPHNYSDFIRISDNLNKTYYPKLYDLNMCGYIYPNTMTAIMDPMMWLHEQEGLKVCMVPLCPSTSYYDKCESLYYEIERPLEAFETKEPANVIMTGFTTESMLHEADGSELKRAIKKSLSVYPRITLVLDLAFYLPDIMDIVWEVAEAGVRSGKINLMIAENWHKYKGFGIEKCLSARLVVVNNDSPDFSPLSQFLDARQPAFFDYHVEFQYVLSIIEQGFKHELGIMALLESNRDEMFKIDEQYSQRFNKPQMFQKSSIMLSTDVDEKYVIQSNIRENCTFGFPFTSYNTFFDPNGAYVSIRIPIGMEPVPILFEKLRPIFEAYYEGRFTRPHAKTVFDLTEQDLAGHTSMYGVKQDAGDSSKQEVLPKTDNVVSVLPSKKAEQGLQSTRETFITGKDACLENTLERIQSGFAKCNLKVITHPVSSPLTGVYYTTAALVDCPFLNGQGKGVSPKAAMASAMGELIELVSNNIFWNFRYLGPQVHQGPYVYFPTEKWVSFDNKSWKYEVLNRNLRNRFQSLNYLNEQSLMDVNAASGKRGFPAMPYQKVSDQRVVFFPNNIITNVYFCNGLAAGNSPSEAKVHALGEIFERYVKLTVIRKNICLPDIPKSYYSDFKNVIDSVKALEQNGFDVWIKDASLNGSYPVINVTVRHRQTGGCYASFGSDPDFQVAIERTITEMLQGRHLSAFEHLPAASSDTKLVSSLKNLEEHFELTGFGVLHTRFFSDKPDFDFRFWRNFGNNDNAFSEFCNILHKFGLDIFIAEYEHLGFYTCRIIVPGMSESFFFDPRSSQFYQSRIISVREELLNLPRLSKEDSRKLHEHLLQAKIPLQQTMNELIGLHANNNGFWDWSRLEDVLFLLQQKIQGKVGQLQSSEPNVYRPGQLDQVLMHKGWEKKVSNPLAFDFSLREQRSIVMVHEKLHKVKKAFYKNTKK